MADGSSTLSVLAGAIPVVGSVVSGLINNANTDANNAANRAFQAQQQDQQNAYNLNMWNMQNAYNAPAAQMARDKAAGLNPNLIYGTADNSVATAAPISVHNSYVAQPKQPVDYGAALANGIKSYNDVRLGTAQVNNMAAQTTNTDEDTLLKQAMTVLDNVTSAKTQAETAVVQPLADSTIAKNAADASSTLQNANVNSFLAPYQADVADANANKSRIESSILIQQNVRDAAMNAMNLREAVARMSAIAVNNAKTQAEQDQIKAQTQIVLGSKALQDMDTSMRLKGMMPNDSAPMRGLQAIWNWITGSSRGTR